MENLKIELKHYIKKNYVPENFEREESFAYSAPMSAAFGFQPAINFQEIFQKSESFSEMLMRLIEESGEKVSDIYKRAGINRQHFYKIRHNENYNPGKQTAVAFAFSLKLNLEKTQELLKTAGYTLTNSNLGDVIEMFFIERENFDIDTVNQFLEEYNQPLLGDFKCNLSGDHKDKISSYNSSRIFKEGFTLANVTEIVFILDRSGSMSGLESDTIGGFNSMLAKHKNGENAAFVSTVLFDHESEVIHDRIPIAEVPNLTDKEYFVRGNTALLDAVGDAVKHIRNIHKYARPEDVPAKTIFIITTDGMENASRRYTYDDIKKLIETQKEKGWDFVFLGANIDSVEVSGRMGISANRAVNYHNDKRGTKARYSSMENFVSAAFAAPAMAFVADEWRKEVDEDFKNRK